MQTNGNYWLDSYYKLVYVDRNGKVLAEVHKEHCDARSTSINIGEEDFIIYEYSSILHQRGTFRNISKENVKREVEKDFG